MFGSNNLNDVTIAQFIIQRNNATVNFCTYATVTYVSMNSVRKVNRTAANGQINNVTTGSEDKHFISEDIHLNCVNEVTGIVHILVPFKELAYPRQFCVKTFVTTASRFAAATFFITPVSSDTVFTNTVHFKGTDLNFQRLTACRKHCCMQGLIHIRFRNCYIVFKATGNRTPHAMHNTQSAVTIFYRINQYTNCKQIVDFAQFFFITQHFFMNAVEVFRSALNFALNVRFCQAIAHFVHSFKNHSFAFTAFSFNLFYQGVVDIRFHITER